MTSPRSSRRSFGAGRQDRAEAGAAPGPRCRRDRDRVLAGAPSPGHEPDRIQTRHRRSEDDPGFRGAGAIARTVEAAADPDRLRHPRRRPERLERLEGSTAARAVSPGPGGHVRRRRHRPARRAHRQGAGPGARAAAGILGRGFRGADPARLSVLLAEPRSGDARPSRPPDARGRTVGRPPDRGEPGRPGPVGHRDHGLYRRPSGPVLTHRRRAVGRRRHDRRRAHRHHGQRHGARHLLGPGHDRRRLRPAGQARAPGRPVRECAGAASSTRARS